MSKSHGMLVAGASVGTGEGEARAASVRGDHLVLPAQGGQSLQRVAGDCRRLGAASTVLLSIDVPDDDAVRQEIEAAVARVGGTGTALALVPRRLARGGP